MKVPTSWLREFVDIPWGAEELGRRLTMAGVEAGGVTVYGGTWDNVCVGRVLSVTPHPNADRLRLATVDIGGGAITVVCGAPNIAEGQKVPFATVGARLFHPQTGKLEQLGAAKIRGIRSEGMVCSERELGLGQDHTGIVVLDPAAPVGTPLAQYLGDAVLDLEVTPNRPDCLSVLGVAREVAALAGGTVHEPDLSYPQAGRPIQEQVVVRIEDPRLCFRYTASLITDIRVGPSPRWLQERLQKAGQRPINNVVDVTNYVMLEYGQPLHAFDYATLADRTIIVRPARPAEGLATLDGERRLLQPPMLVIADARRAVALAGIIGGSETEMTETTQAVLLESATFDPINTRRTASVLKVRTEASSRFEKGLNPELAERALRRATHLILEVVGGRAAQGIVDVYHQRRDPQPILLRPRRLRQVLGVSFPRERVVGVLVALGFRCQRPGEVGSSLADVVESVEGRSLWAEGELLVTPPYWRVDVTQEDDLVEEVARIVGYDSVPTTMLSGSIPAAQPQPLLALRERTKDLLVACGMQETISYSLVGRDTLEKAAALDGGPAPLRVANPMSPAQEYLRTSLRGSILTTLAANERTAPDEGLRLFEAGRVYLPRQGDLPEEREVVVAVFCGPRHLVSWLGDRAGMDFFDAKGTAEAVLDLLGIQAEFEPHQDSLLHPGRCARVVAQGRNLGVVGELHPRARAAFDIVAPRVALFELDLEAVSAALPSGRGRYEPSARYPGALRDVALVVDREVPAERLRSIIEGHPLVVRATVFDVYEGKGVPEGKKSLAYHLVLQSAEGTLTAEQVSTAVRDVLARLSREVGAALRAGEG